MKRRQKKVQEFLDSLKVGDRIVTTGGIYGPITKLSEKSVQLQIADKVRIEVSRRPPSSATRARTRSVPERRRPSHDTCEPSLESRSRSSPCSSSSPASASIRSWRGATGHRPPAWLMDKRLQARSRPQGRRAPGAARADRRRAAAGDRDRMRAAARRARKTRSVAVTSIDCTDPTHVPCRRRAAGAGRGVPAGGDRDRRRLRPRAPAPAAPTRFTMRPNIAA